MGGSWITQPPDRRPSDLEQWESHVVPTDALAALRAEVEAAHTHVQNAQRMVYGDGSGRLPVKVRRRVPYALNRAQNTLIKLLVHENWPRPR